MDDWKKNARSLKVLAVTAAAALLLFGCANKEAAGGASKGDEQAKASEPEKTADHYDNMSNEDLVSDVSYYDESAKSAQQVKSEHQQAVNVVERVTGTNPDLNSEEGRDRVRAAATNTQTMTPAEKKWLQGLLKEMAKVENKQINDRIKELAAKAKKGTLTPKERAELVSLLPEKNPGQPIQPGPVKETPNEKPETETPDQPESPEKPGTEEPRQPGDSRQEDESGNQEPGEPGGTGQGDDNRTQEPQLPGGSQQGDDDNQEPQLPGESQQGDDDGNREPQQPGDSQQGDDNGNQEPQQPGDSRQGAQNGSQQPRQPEETPQPQPQPQPAPGKEANGYDRAKVRDYAYQWWNKRNNAQYGWYSRQKGGCYNCWYDCTNFVSQAMKAGGFKEKKGRYDWYDYWYYNDDQPAMTWGVAHSFFKHMKHIRKAQQAAAPSELKVGDILNADFERDGKIDHSVIITKIENGIIYATYHTSDNKDKPINDWFALYNVYGWKMGTAKN